MMTNRFQVAARNNPVRVYLVTLAVASLPLVIFGFLAHQLLLRQVTQRTLTQGTQVAGLVGNVIEQNVDRDKDVFAAFAKRQDIVKSIQDRNFQNVAAELEQAAAMRPEFVLFSVCDPDGTLRAAYPVVPGTGGAEGRANKNFRSEDWFQGVTKESQPYVSDVYQAATENVSTAKNSVATSSSQLIAIAVPIKDSNGRTIGLLMAAEKIDTLLKEVHALTTPQSASIISLMDQHGNVFGNPRASLTAIKLEQDKSADQADQELVAQVRSEAASSKLQRINGQETLISFSPIASFHWGVLIDTPASGLKDALWEYEKGLLILGLFIVAIAGGCAAFVARLYVAEKLRLQVRMQQSQKMEAVGQLAGGVSHDFNNLLGVMMGQAELLKDELQDPTLRSRADSIITAAERGASLTGQLLAFSRKQVLNRTVLSLNKLVQETAKLLGRTLGADIKLECKLDEGLWSANLDPGQIQGVILNLALNARDAMPKGGKLTIETFNVPRQDVDLKGVEGTIGDYVCLAVSDNGEGMSEEVRLRIFEPFFTTKAAGKGTGLGLAMVYGIVKQSGGQIWVYSELGKGTAFKMYFPRTTETAQPSVTRHVTPVRGTETVLVVEDQEGFREVMVDVLKNNGYAVLQAVNGKEALRSIEKHSGPIHLVITDMIMPEMSGSELGQHLKKILPGTKVLFVSGYTGDAMYRQGAFAEDAEFLQKPFSPSALQRKVYEVLHGAQEKRDKDPQG